MPDRDLDISKFSYFAYRKLKKTLGEFDAVVECNEIAIREFLEKAKKEDSYEYIKQLSSKHKLKVDEVDFFKFSSRIRQYYISSVFQQSEQFLKDYKEEWTNYFDKENWIEPNKGETKLQNTLRNLNLTLPNDLIDFYEYYRLLRNFMAHSDRDIDELRSRHLKIESNKNDFIRGFHLNSIPNKLDDIDFSDFLILTNIIKHIAYLISTSSKPKNKRIAEILLNKSKENEGKAFKGIKKLKNDIVRYEKAINNYIATTFGRLSKIDSDETMIELKSLLA